MSREDAVVLASRTLAVLVTLWVLTDISYLPGYALSFRHYAEHEVTAPTNAAYWQYWSHHYLVDMSFLITRIIGLSLMARWLFRGGTEVARLLLPTEAESQTIQS
jgi:hypothetical protein